MSESVLSLVNSDEIILYTGSYLIADRVLRQATDKNGNIVVSTSTIPMQVEINPGYNLYVSVTNPLNDNLLPPNNFVQRNLTISSYNNDLTKRIGQISCVSINYEQIVPPFTTSNIERFDINSTSGIYNNITGIIVDFSTPPEQPRIVYFLGSICDCDCNI